MSRTLVGALALFFVFTLGGCEDSAGVGGSGSLSILLTDNPGFLMAQVGIERIELVGGGGEDGEGGGSVVLWEGFVKQDLLELANDVAVLVDEATVPDGTYSQLRFIIPGACIVPGEVVEEVEVPSGVYASPDYGDCGLAYPNAPTGDLQLPSFAQTGIKVNLPDGGLEVAGDQQILLVDFDVPESFGHEAGNSEKWVMHPVIKAESMSLTGSITVEIAKGDPALSDVNLAEYYRARLDEETPVEFTCPEGQPEGQEKCTATFLYLLPDEEHQVSVVPIDGQSLEGFEVDPPDPQPVTPISGQDVKVSFAVKTSTSP
jgi:hypothetical protein